MGALNRVIRLAAHPGEVRAALEDDVHHFRVRLLHDGAAVTGIAAEGVRTPYTLCGRAGDELQALEGMALTQDVVAVLRATDERLQCTHQFDLAALAIAMAARGDTERRYHACVHDRQAGAQLAVLTRDGVEAMRWTVRDYAIAAPASWQGRSLGEGFSRFVATTMPPEQAESALVLRRAVFISGARRLALDDLVVRQPRSGGACWVQQPERAASSTSNTPFRLDFTGRAEALTSADQAWLKA